MDNKINHFLNEKNKNDKFINLKLFFIITDNHLYI